MKAVKGAHCVVTDTWVSMGQTDADHRKKILEAHTVDQALMAKAAKDAIFMHCLPAYRGHEVTEEVIDGPQSVIFDEAENRLHAQKAILAWCLGAVMADAAATTETLRTPSDDLVLPFRTVHSGVIGRLVRLGSVVDEILLHHAAPAPVSQALGEAVALGALLGTALKIDAS